MAKFSASVLGRDSTLVRLMCLSQGIAENQSPGSRGLSKRHWTIEAFGDMDYSMPETISILPQDGVVTYMPKFFSDRESDGYLSSLQTECTWRTESIQLFGRTVMQPRLTALYGDPDKAYRYSGLTMQPLPWTETLTAIKARVEQTCGSLFSTVLLNQYRHERDSMGWHRDNEKELGSCPLIASVSFGAPRVFHFRHRFDKSLRVKMELGHGSLLIMQGQTQDCWEHALPKLAKPVGVRINLTFRNLLASA